MCYLQECCGVLITASIPNQEEKMRRSQGRHTFMMLLAVLVSVIPRTSLTQSRSRVGFARPALVESLTVSAVPAAVAFNLAPGAGSWFVAGCHHYHLGAHVAHFTQSLCQLFLLHDRIDGWSWPQHRFRAVARPGDNRGASYFYAVHPDQSVWAWGS